MLKQTNTPNAPGAIGPYSQAISHGGLVFTSGQIPLDPKTGEVVGSDVAAQAEMVMKNLGAVLEASGAGFDSVVKTTCFITNMRDFAAFNEVYSKYFTADPKPARSCFAVRELPKSVLCEVEAIAVIKLRSSIEKPAKIPSAVN